MFEIFLGSNDEFYFHLKAKNGQIILQSEGYTQKNSCENGIGSVRENSQDETCFARKEAKDGRHYFVLKAQNGQVIGTSQMYENTSGMENGIQSVVENAPDAQLHDNT